jgi:K+-transporting ATPase ATPase C chain
MVICCLLYPLVIWGLGQTLTPNSANGSLVSNDRGEIVGSALIAQKFDRPEYFWPRPSAVDYNAAAAGGSNRSPAHPELRERAMNLAARFRASAAAPIPADLVTASGSGLDPDITLAAAKYQAARVAAARGLPVETLVELLDQYARRPGGALTPQPLVNVLRVNMALDGLGK